MDIDDFKTVVDTHGHLYASQTLQEVGQIIQSGLPSPAYGVAYGGDEFVVVLPGYSKTQAMSLAESLRKAIKSHLYLQNEGLAVRICASMGVSTYPADADGVNSILALADQAMFAVKKRGKDSICATEDACKLPARREFAS